MLPSPFTRLLVEPLDIRLELLPVDPPHPASADLDRRQLARADEGICLGHADGEVRRDVLILLMSAALVVAIWSVASDRLIEIVSAALSSVCGSLGC